MGGKNHQPCRSYLLNSTKLSRHLSLAYAHLELSNASLEDIIIGELTSEHGCQGGDHYPVLMHELDVSTHELRNAQEALLRLRTQMQTDGFIDLPSLGRIDLDSVGAHLVHQDVVDYDGWTQAKSIMEKGGFFEMTHYFETGLIELLDLSQGLHTRFQELKQNICQGTLSMVTEENQAGNFKIEFAILYTRWGQFNKLFLASSLLSTELWYAFTGKGSLTSPESQFRAA